MTEQRFFWRIYDSNKPQSGSTSLHFTRYLCGRASAATYAQRPPAPGFLQSTSVRIQLGVWDKYDVDTSNRARFVVTAPNGKQYVAERTESLDDWVYVHFPDDFSPSVSNSSVYTLYSWKCMVGGKSVAGGKFRWGGGRADDDNRNLR